MRSARWTLFLLIILAATATGAIAVGTWRFTVVLNENNSTSLSEQRKGGAQVSSMIEWHSDLELARQQARAQDKLIVIDFCADWCMPCNKMDRTTFQHADVRRRLHDFVAVKVDIDEQGDIARRYEVGALPTSLIVEPSGSPVVRQVGYLGPEAYLGFLDRVADEQRPPPGAGGLAESSQH